MLAIPLPICDEQFSFKAVYCLLVRIQLLLTMRKSAFKSLVFSTLLTAVLVLGGSVQNIHAQAGPPDRMSYQGFLVDGAGAPIGATPVNREVIFRIYDASNAGTLLWAERQIVTVNRGYFSVFLGEGSVNGAEPRPGIDTIFTGAGSSERYIETTLKSLTGGP